MGNGIRSAADDQWRHGKRAMKGKAAWGWIGNQYILWYLQGGVYRQRNPKSKLRPRSLSSGTRSSSRAPSSTGSKVERSGYF